jgi:hypothetical protein
MQNAITEVLGGIFGEMRRHLTSYSCRRYGSWHFLAIMLPKNKTMQAGAVNKGR